MVIFMPYYHQHRSNSINSYKITTNILCRFLFSLVLLTIACCLIRISLKSEGSPIVAAILLTIAIISFIRTYQKLRQYYTIIDSRRRILRRLNEQQHVQNDLPSYKQLYPSHLNLSLDTVPPPPSYDDYMKNTFFERINVTYV